MLLFIIDLPMEQSRVLFLHLRNQLFLVTSRSTIVFILQKKLDAQLTAICLAPDIIPQVKNKISVLYRFRN